MPKSIFDYQNYKAYLVDWVEEKGRGERSKIASVLRCHLAYVSQVLNDDAQLSLEQADQLNTYLAHSEDQAEFFLLLVSLERAGTASLRKLYETKIKRILHERTLLENRLKNKKVLPAESQAIYYTAWYYSAIHLLISIPGFQTKEEIARHLRLPMNQINQALEFLVATGLAEFNKARYQSGQVTLHLTNDSPWLPRYHSNWRLQAIQSLDRPQENQLNYTSVVSMSEEDAPAIRKILIEAIEQVRAVVRKSPEKGAYCYTVDFFTI
ncbi:TIGR02147 family protein [Bdellovibrionota bacterium FG-1]